MVGECIKQLLLMDEDPAPAGTGVECVQYHLDVTIDSKSLLLPGLAER